MAITPKQAAHDRSRLQAKTLDDLESKVDALLVESPYYETRDLGSVVTEEQAEELARRFRRAGWRVVLELKDNRFTMVMLDPSESPTALPAKPDPTTTSRSTDADRQASAVS